MKKHLYWIFLLILWLNPALEVYGQKQIEGQVIDSNSREPISFVNIMVVGKTYRGTISDLDGKFALTVEKTDKKLRLSCVGYRTKVVEISRLQQDPTIQLAEKPLGMKPVVVTPKTNPAIPVIRKAIEHRKQNDPWRLEAFSLKSYNKYAMTTSRPEPDSAEQPDSVRHTNASLKDTANVDTSKNIKVEDSVKSAFREVFSEHHLFLMESITQRIHKKPDVEKGIVLAQQISGIEKPEFPIPSIDQKDMNFYETFLEVFGEEYRSPISPGALNKYQYQMNDTITRDHDTIYLIRFFPKKGRGYRALEGFLGIHAESYSLALIKGAGARDDLQNVQFKQIHKNHDSIWYPHQLFAEMKYDKYDFGWEMSNYIQSVNPAKLSKIDRKDLKVELAEGALEKDSSYWHSARPIPLTERDQGTYTFHDTTEEMDFNWIMEAADKLLENRFPLGKVDIWVTKLYDRDQYQGHRAGIGLLTSDEISEYFSVGGYFGYGFRDQTTKYGGRLELYPTGNKDLAFNFNYEHDVEEVGKFNFIRTFYRSQDVGFRGFLAERMSAIDRYRLAFMTRRIRYLRLNLFGRVSQEKLLGNFQYPVSQREDGEPLLNEESGKFVESGIKLRFAYGEENFRFFGKKVTSDLPYPALYLNYIKGWESTAFGGDFAYTRVKGRIKHDFNLRGFGEADVTVEGGKVYGKPPASRLAYGPGSFSRENRSYNALTFQTMRPYEFIHSKYLNLFYSHKLVEIDPGFKQSRPTIFLKHAMGIGTLGDEYQRVENGFKTMEKGFYESGLQIKDILRFSYFDTFYLGIGAGGMYRYGPYHLPDFEDNLAAMVNVGISF